MRRRAFLQFAIVGFIVWAFPCGAVSDDAPSLVEELEAIAQADVPPGE